ncbi:hypothetical protein V2J09_001747 [Rumex salicifolius]
MQKVDGGDAENDGSRRRSRCKNAEGVGDEDNGLQNNLLSIGQLQEKSLWFLIKHGTCKVFHERNGLLFETHMKANRMFVLHALSLGSQVTTQDQCLMVSKAEKGDLELLHKRFGHLNHQGLRKLQQKSMVNGLPQLKATDQNIASVTAEGNELTTDESTQVETEEEEEVKAESIPQAELGPRIRSKPAWHDEYV